MSIVSKITGTGSYLPERILTNFDLEKMVETSDSWIRERTGIVKRHIADPLQTNTDLGLQAALKALDSAGLSKDDIDVIIYATVTPDQVMPSAACTLQKKLGSGPLMAFDISAACSGFVYGLQVADAMIRSGQAKNILVVGAETLSRIVDYRDRETCILFGDAAGAVILSASQDEKGSRFHSFQMRANGALGDLLYLDSGRPMDTLKSQALTFNLPFVKMKGREIFKSAVRAMADCCDNVLKANGLTPDDVNWMIPHQANIRIIEAVGDYLGIDEEKVIINISETGNTSSASIPITFDRAVREGKIKRGDNVLFTAFGGGLTYGATVFQY